MSNKKKEGIVYSTNPDFQSGDSHTSSRETLPNDKQNLLVRIIILIMVIIILKIFLCP